MRWVYGLMLCLVTGVALFIYLDVANAGSNLADSGWPVFHGNNKLTGQSEYDTSKVNGTLKWSFKTDAGTETSPVIGQDGTIYIADHACFLYAIGENGKEKWRFDAGDPVNSIEWGGQSCFHASPAIGSDGTIYIAPMTGYLFAVDSTGKEKWRYPVLNYKNNWSSPAIGPDGTVYVGSESYPPPESKRPQEQTAHIYAINSNGTLRWKYDTGGNWSTSTASIADDGTVYMSGNDCRNDSSCPNILFAFNGSTGQLKWKFNHGGVMESSASLGADGTIYFGVKGRHNPREGKFYAVTPAGKEKWSYELSSGNSIVPGIAKDGTIYFGDWDGYFYAISPEGRLIWRTQTPKGFETLSSSPAIGADGTIYFGSMRNYFYAYTPDGKEKWKYQVKNGGINSSPAIGKDGTVYVAFIPGELVAFGSIAPAIFKQLPATALYLVAAIILLVALLVCLAFFQKKLKLRWYSWLALVLIWIIFVVSLMFVLSRLKADNRGFREGPGVQNSLQEMFKYGEDFEKICPDKIVLESENQYKAVLRDRDWIVPNMRQIDWISESCPDTVWP